jgi:hypothetical protein
MVGSLLGSGAVVVALLTPSTAWADAADGNVWDRLARCESGGNWGANTGNGFYGGLQFWPSTWAAFGGRAYAPRADLATRKQQIAIGRRVLASQGWKAWPACSRKLGLSGTGEPEAPAEPDGPADDSGDDPSGRTHVVKQGESLSLIAGAYGVPGGWKALHRANRDVVGADADRIRAGVRLRVSGTGT